MAEQNVSLAEKNLALGIHIVCSRNLSAWDRDDEIQEAYLGLRHAEELFNPELGKFSSYAGDWVREYLAKHRHLLYGPVKLPAPTTGKSARENRARQIRTAVHCSAESVAEILPAPTENLDARLDVERLLKILDPRSQEIVRQYYLRDRTLVEVAVDLNISRSRAHVLLTRAMDRLRQAI